MIRNYALSALTKLLTIVYALFVLKATSAYLTEDEFSTFFLLSNLVLYLAPVLFGMQGAMLLRFYHHSKENLAETVRTLNIIAIITTALIAGVLAYSLSELNIIILAMYVVSFGLYQYLISGLRARHKFKKIASYTFFQASFVIVLILIYGQKYNEAIYFLLVIAMSYGVIIAKERNILSSIFHLSEYRTFSVKNIDAPLVRYSWPIILIAVFNSMLSSMDQYFLYYSDYKNDLAGYIANYNIGEKAIFSLLSIISLVFVPSVFKRYKNVSLAAINEIYKVAAIFLILSSIIVLGMYFFAEELTILLTDKKYISSSWIIPVVGGGAIILGIISIIAEVFTIKMQTMTLMRVFLLAFILNGSLNIILIPDFGVVGAITSTLLAYFLALIYLIFLVSQEKIKLKGIRS